MEHRQYAGLELERVPSPRSWVGAGWDFAVVLGALAGTDLLLVRPALLGPVCFFTFTFRCEGGGLQL